MSEGEPGLRHVQPADRLQNFARRLEQVRARIESAARRAGRDPARVRLLGASKTVDAARLRAAIRAGLADVGENRVQEAAAKRHELADLDGRVTWHLIGHLQSNKAGAAVTLFDWIHSLDSPELARALDRRARAAGRRVRVLVEVNTSGEASKFGVPPENTPELLAALAGLQALEPRGLMTIGPLAGGEDAARAAFRTLARQLGEAQRAFPDWTLDQLSMGMSDDLEAAVEEGATWVRVGRALFGERPEAGPRT